MLPARRCHKARIVGNAVAPFAHAQECGVAEQQAPAQAERRHAQESTVLTHCHHQWLASVRVARLDGHVPLRGREYA